MEFFIDNKSAQLAEWEKLVQKMWYLDERVSLYHYKH